MPAGSEFHTEGAATLKPREAKVVWTRETDNRLVLEERRELSRLRGVIRVKSVMSVIGVLLTMTAHIRLSEITEKLSFCALN